MFMKQEEIKFKDLLNEDDMICFPISYNTILLVINSKTKPADYFKGRAMNSIQNENMTIKGNGMRVAISKFITK